MANTTKRMLSMSLKKLLSKTTLDNITIQDITDDAEVSRKTFYYHFQDIYDLLDWTLQEDARHLVEADQNFIVSVYGLGITGLFLRWIGANMMSPPEPMIRQLYRLMGGSLQGVVQRFLTTADTE